MGTRSKGVLGRIGRRTKGTKDKFDRPPKFLILPFKKNKYKRIK